MRKYLVSYFWMIGTRNPLIFASIPIAFILSVVVIPALDLFGLNQPSLIDMYYKFISICILSSLTSRVGSLGGRNVSANPISLDEIFVARVERSKADRLSAKKETSFDREL
jgi:hypothetical protein